MLCEYCQTDGKDLFNARLFKLVGTEYRISGVIYPDSKKLYIFAESSEAETLKSIKIQYCPMCGRKFN